MRYKPGDMIHLWLKDEVPKIGSGHRYVQMVQFGYKWVRVKLPYKEQAIRIPRRKWDRLAIVEDHNGV